jgi:type 1 glutamine amidotransferase
VLLRLDASKVDLARKGVRRKDKDFAVIWARNYGKGRVLYNGLGHGEDTWERADIQKMWLDMVRWSMGDLPGNATPRPAPAVKSQSRNGDRHLEDSEPVPVSG